MNPEMLEDLGRWERGEVSVDDLAERHPEGKPAALAEMHTLITMLTAEPDTDRGPSWERLAASLPAQEVVVADPPARRQGRLKYFLAAFVTGAVIAPGTAAADGVEMIREVTEHVGRGLGSLVMPDRPVAASVSAPVEGPAADSGSSGFEIAAAPVPSAPTDPVAGVPTVADPAAPAVGEPDPAPVASPKPAPGPSPAPAPPPSPSSPSGGNDDAAQQPPPPPASDAGPSAGSASRPPNAGGSDASAPDESAASPSSPGSSESGGGDHSRSDRGNDEHRMKDERRGGKDRRSQT